MRIVLDLQACQSSSRFRGIGRYSLALAQALARNAGSHEIWLALNGYMADTVMPIRQAFDGLVPSERVAVFSIPGPVAELDPANAWRARAAELVREHALAEISPDIVHVASLFEGWVDNVTTSIGALDSSVVTCATLYDLIPLKYSETHLRSPVHRDWYYRKIDSLKNANLLLAISDYSRCEAIVELGISPDRITNISAGVAATFGQLQISEAGRVDLLGRYGISRPFLLYTGNLEPHKNLEGAIKGFAAIPFEVRRAHQLVIVSQMDDANRRRLLKLITAQGLGEDDVLLTGYVSETDLVLLYNLCKAFVFPSLYEGFGLPALEAMACGAPTIGSRAASIPEVIGRDDAMFDPSSIPSIAKAMHRVLADDEFRESLRAHALTQRERFSWDDAARRAIDTMEEAWERRNAHARLTASMPHDGRYQALLNKFAVLEKGSHPTDDDLRSFAAAVSFNEVNRSEKQLLVDVSALAVQDARTGIQRVVRSILSHLLSHPPAGYRVEPVYGDNGGFYRYARRFLRRFQGLDQDGGEDLPIEARRGDIFLGLDLSAHLFPVFRPVLAHFQRVGVKVHFVVYDVIPLLNPQWCAQGMPQAFATWMDAISSHADGLVCISTSVADEVRLWLKDRLPSREGELKVGFFHLGADIDNSVPSRGLPDGADELLMSLASAPSFLMVGTIEPRKGHAQVVAAFDRLWESGVEANLVIVGKAGWNVDTLTEKLNEHPALGRRLYWLAGISDEYLERIYQVSAALIAASEAEGFGLPLIEAAQHKLPIIARDIPVFREIASDNAYYFAGGKGEALAENIRQWLSLRADGLEPRVDGISWITWAESSTQLLNQIIPKPFSAPAPPMLGPPLPLPDRVTEQELYEFVTSVRVEDAPEEEMHAYGSHDFRRFVYTWGLAKDLSGTCLELGANPYFTTMLLKEFTDLELHLANYFGALANGEQTQKVRFIERVFRTSTSAELKFQHFNVENDPFPYPDNHFDLVIFAEIIEHLLIDPCGVLREIHRILKPDAHLILTTPNVARLENITRLIAGVNIYDPYSGYGPYGRHNREYNLHELVMLLRHEGFEPEIHFTADVHTNNASAFARLSNVSPLVQFRSSDLGQYIFIRAKKSGKTSGKRPVWLYRSYPNHELE